MPENFDISDLLTAELIVVPLPGSTKQEVLDHLIEVASASPMVDDPERVRKAVYEREAKMSTGVGSGLALPHARTDAVDGTVMALGIAPDPVDFDALDGEPVRIVFLLLGKQSDTSMHIRILSRISRLLNRSDVRNALQRAETPEEALATLRQVEVEMLAD